MCIARSPLSEIYTLEYSPESSPFCPCPLIRPKAGGLTVVTWQDKRGGNSAYRARTLFHNSFVSPGGCNRKNLGQGREPRPRTIARGRVNSFPFQNFRRAARISATAAAFFSGVNCSISGRKGAATSVNSSQNSSSGPGHVPGTKRDSLWTFIK